MVPLVMVVHCRQTKSDAMICRLMQKAELLQKQYILAVCFFTYKTFVKEHVGSLSMWFCMCLAKYTLHLMFRKQFMKNETPFWTSNAKTSLVDQNF